MSDPSDAARRYEASPISGFHLRLVLGYLLAPFLPGLVIWLLLVLFGEAAGLIGPFYGLFLVLAVVGYFTVPATLLCGIPAHVLCHRLAWQQWWVAVAGGTIIGGIFALLGLALSLGPISLLFPVCGALSAFGLWAILYASPKVRCLTLFAPMTLLALAALSRSLIAS